MSHIAEQLLRRKLRYRDLVGARVRLVQRLETFGRVCFMSGSIMDVANTYRGSFSLSLLKGAQPTLSLVADGPPERRRAIGGVPAAAVELLKCRVCGCDPLHACQGQDGPCSWSLKNPTLCTACEAKGAPDAS